jgi:hypothetical protein
MRSATRARDVIATLSGKYALSMAVARTPADTSATIIHRRSFNISHVRACSKRVATAHFITSSRRLGNELAKNKAKVVVLVKFSGM